MKKLNLLFFLFICFIGCSKNESVIEGRIPDKSYDNEYIYLVPFKNPTKETVVSTLIRNGSFRFKVNSEKQNQIYIIRVRPALRFDLQPILVIPEQGIVDVLLDKHSTASGTPLNQILQQWKEEKRISDSTYYSILHKYKKGTNESEKVQYQSELKDISEKYQTYADSLAEVNKDNIIGQFIRSLSKK